MTQIPKLSRLFATSLASSMSASATSFEVVSSSDGDGNALFGLYGFKVDGEFILGTISGTTVTVVKRGQDADAPETEVAANKVAHRRGSVVEITDYPVLAYLRNALAGEAGYELPAPLKYATGVGPLTAHDLVDKEYADALAISGAGLGTTSTAGLFEEATQAQIDADTGAGDDVPGARLAVNPSTLGTSKYATRLPTADQKAALAGGGLHGTPSASNKYRTEAYGKAAVVQTYNANDTWTKPSGLSHVEVELWGAGGGGGGSNAGAGGGEAYASKRILAADLAATEAVTVGAGGAAGAGTDAGSAGGNSSFGSHITAYGGGGGGGNNNGSGGGGGGQTSAGASAVTTTAGAGGGPMGGTAGSSSNGGTSVFGGGGGGGGAAGSYNGGQTIYGGGGGASGGGNGGGGNSVWGGGGGATTGSGSAGTSVHAGAGGKGAAGTAPAGGGGSSGTVGYAGAAGRVKVTEFFY